MSFINAYAFNKLLGISSYGRTPDPLEAGEGVDNLLLEDGGNFLLELATPADEAVYLLE